MPAYFSKFNPFEQHLAKWLRDLQGVWEGRFGVPFRQTAVNDADSYAVEIKNVGTGGKGLRVYGSDGTLICRADDAGFYPEMGAVDDGWERTSTTVHLETATDDVVVGQDTHTSQDNFHVHDDRIRIDTTLTPTNGVSSTAYSDVVRADSPTCYLPLDEPISYYRLKPTAYPEPWSRIYDWSFNPPVVTSHAARGVSRTTGPSNRIKRALNFTGETGQSGIRLPLEASPTSHSTGSWGFEVWVRPTDVTDLHYIMSSYDRSTSTLSNYRVYVLAGKLGMFIGGETAETTTTVVNGTWYHFAGTFVGDSGAGTGILRVYLNGTLETTVAAATANPVDANYEVVQLGHAYPGAKGLVWQGDLAHFATYRTAPLPGAVEFLAHYNAGLDAVVGAVTSGYAGEIGGDTEYIYDAIGTNDWKRIPVHYF